MDINWVSQRETEGLNKNTDKYRAGKKIYFTEKEVKKYSEEVVKGSIRDDI
jgi:hypothetical protein